MALFFGRGKGVVFWVGDVFGGEYMCCGRDDGNGVWGLGV